MSSDRKGKDRILEMVARPKVRSSLFWWLLENHDELVEAEGETGLGLRWGELCGQFAELGLADVNGKPATEQTAQKTWWRVRKARARLAERRAAAEAARAANRASNPRGNMPSQWRGTYAPALVEKSSARSAVMASASRALVPAGEPGGKIEPWEEEGLTDEERNNLKTQLLGVRAEFARTDKHNTPKPNKRF
jgi:hypothetical protein